MSAKEFRELVRKAQVERRERLQSKFEAILCQAQKEAEKGKCHIYFEEKCWDPILVEMIKQRGFHVSVSASHNPRCVACTLVQTLGKQLCQACEKSDVIVHKVTWGNSLDGEELDVVDVVRQPCQDTSEAHAAPEVVDSTEAMLAKLTQEPEELPPALEAATRAAAPQAQKAVC
jgi:hypothetical protein